MIIFELINLKGHFMVKASMKDFDIFEQQFIELLGEFQSISTSETRLREAVRTESTRAEAAEAARESAVRAASEARSSAAAAAASATQAAAALAKAQDDLTGLKMQLELVERQRTLLEERCTEITTQVGCLERELQQLRPLQSAHAALQRQYVELQERICSATEEARKESSRLEAELRRVERCASGGSEIRERARLAAAAHARERKLAAAELQHATRELRQANAEIARLGALVAELQLRATHTTESKPCIDESETVLELRAALEAERAGTSRLEIALASALSDNAALAASMHASDNTPTKTQRSAGSTPPMGSSAICPIDSFLAD
ncbi:centrosomal protein of 164 kDa-like [Ostrinia furnacalis]|uniref:centrosomal protein of 164 kDa-like n=1 Tax=Ostrinia furnacalis TaxID=93504 RepID=UPI00103A03A3|nr:centrosomal protein of 164 kDa-like [Ostrinia furnacalis]